LSRTRHYRDLLAWQRAMEVARQVYLHTEEFPKSEIFGLRMQMRRSAVSLASNIAEGHGRLTDPQLRNSLGMAPGSLYELQTQTELACNLQFLTQESSNLIVNLSTEVAMLINGLLGVLNTE